MEMRSKIGAAMCILANMFMSCWGIASAGPGSDGLDDQPILPRPTTEEGAVLWSFDRDVWPAMDDYNGFPAQGGSGYGYLLSVMDKDVFKDHLAWVHLTNGVKRMGNVSIDGDEPRGPSRSGSLHRVNSRITSYRPPDATVQVCYTYPTTAGGSGASEATVDLRKKDKTDHWFLNAVRNDHVVSGC